jgi:hypothetical protein
MKKPRIPEEVLEFFKRTAAKGGRVRATRYSKKQLQAWGKMGGRPKGSGKKQAKRGAK